MRSPRPLRFAQWLMPAALAWAVTCPVSAHAATCSSPAAASVDTDGDGICDLDDPIDGQLNVLQITIKKSFHLGLPNTNGSVVVRGDFDTMPPTNVFDISEGIIATFVDSYLPPSGPLDVAMAWTAAECATNARGRTRCKSADGKSSATFKVMGKSAPGVVRFGLRLKHLDINAPFLEPVTVTLTNGVTDRVDVADECRATVSGIVCKKL